MRANVPERGRTSSTAICARHSHAILCCLPGQTGGVGNEAGQGDGLGAPFDDLGGLGVLVSMGYYDWRAIFSYVVRVMSFPLDLGKTLRGTPAKVATAGSTSSTLQCSGEVNDEVQAKRARRCRGQEWVGRGTARQPALASWRVASLLAPRGSAKKVYSGLATIHPLKNVRQIR